MSYIIVTQHRSLISEPENLRKVVKSLGLGRIGKTKKHKDNNCIRGMVNKVKHLVKFELSSK
jgi:large subunit ribosomal protein L30